MKFSNQFRVGLLLASVFAAVGDAKEMKFKGDGDLNLTNAPCADIKYTTPKIKKNVKVGWEAIHSAPMVGPDGLIYIGTSQNEEIILNKNGDIVKRIPLADSSDAEAGFLSDGNAVIADNSGKVYIINSNGSKKQIFDNEADIHGNILISKDKKTGEDRISFGGINGMFNVLDKDGTYICEFASSGMKTNSESKGINSISALPDGGFAVSSSDSRLYFLKDDCTEKNRPLVTNGFVKRPALVDSDGTIKTTSFDGYAYFLNADGTVKAKFRTDDKSASEVVPYPPTAKYPDGFYMFSSFDGKVYLLDKDAKKIMPPISIGAASMSTPVVLPNGLIAIASEDSYIHYFNLSGIEVGKVKIDAPLGLKPVVLEDGTLVVPSSNSGKIQYIESPQPLPDFAGINDPCNPNGIVKISDASSSKGDVNAGGTAVVTATGQKKAN